MTTHATTTTRTEAVSRPSVRDLEEAANAVSAGLMPVSALIELLVASRIVDAAVRQQLINADAVDEVTQEVLLAVATQIHQWDGRGSFAGWVRRICRNKAVDRIRRRAVRPEQPIEHASPSGGRFSSIVTTRRLLIQLINRLPDTYRTPLLLRDIHHLDYPDIADHLGTTVSTARQRVTRGRAIVASHWTRATA